MEELLFYRRVFTPLSSEVNGNSEAHPRLKELFKEISNFLTKDNGSQSSMTATDGTRSEELFNSMERESEPMDAM